jgi:5-methylcytosine-specific restriction enzyme A
MDLMKIDDVVENRTICDVFGVSYMGGIRVNKARDLIVLISNNTDPTYRDEWTGDVLHFAGMGSIGPQKA